MNLEIAQAVSQRRLSLSTILLPGRKCVEASDDVIKASLRDSRILSRHFSKKLVGFEMTPTAYTFAADTAATTPARLFEDNDCKRSAGPL